MSTHTPWPQVVTLREDLLSGGLALHLFAADLYEVAMQSGERPLYEEPDQFFARTHATHNMRRLVTEVAARLGGRSDKAVRKLALTYGGGKTHTLITLLHFFGRQDELPDDLPAVRDFRQAAGKSIPKARVATIAFDKLDVEKGMVVLSPTGERRQLMHPWSLLAYQLAGDDGLRALHKDGLAEERDTPPTEQYLKEVLQVPAQDDLATLVLFDEVLIYARNKASMGETWRKRTIDFFQALTQAVTKTDNTALVVSLLANDLKPDAIGKRLAKDLEDIVSRQKEEDVQPVEKRDVAQVLRQQFFTPESVSDTARLRSHALAAVAAVAEIDEHTQRGLADEEDRYASSYPFHPELTEVFYTKWTNIEQFQQTRGVLRTFAIALRDAAPWDTSPLVGPHAFLTEATAEPLSDAALELATVARNATTAQGDTVNWPNILEGELRKAREIQADLGTLPGREVEAAALSVFLHSQPTMQSAPLQELLALVGHTGPIKIELDKGLVRWARSSWYLDDERLDAWASKDTTLPQEWRLGGKPNLRQMHDHAREKLVREEEVAIVLDRTIRELDAVKQGTAALGVKPHTLPKHPRDIDNDAVLHLAVLDPQAASEPSDISDYAKRYLTTHTSEDKPRSNRNNIILVVPSTSGLSVARNAIREKLAWDFVKKLPDYESMPQVRKTQVIDRQASATKEVSYAVRQAYCIAVTYGSTKEIQAFKLTVGAEPLFTTVKNDERARIQETAVEPSALLPDGPYKIWPDKAKSVLARDLVEGFFRYPRLPKLVSPEIVRDTLVRGCLDGTFALRYTRGDGSVRTYWLEKPEDAALEDKSLEAVLPQHASLAELNPALLEPGALPSLWSGDSLTIADVYAYFAGGYVAQRTLPGTDFEEPLPVPQANPEAIKRAVVKAVEEGRLWLTAGTVSLWQEAVPESVLTDKAELRSPPDLIAPQDLLPETLPEAWSNDTATARSLYDAILAGRDDAPPWSLVAQSIADAFNTRVFETDDAIVEWPIRFDQADTARFRLPGSGAPTGYTGGGTTAVAREQTAPNVRVARATLGIEEIQDLADAIADVQTAAAGHSIRFELRVELGDGQPVPSDVVEKIAALLSEVSADLDLS